MYRAQTWPRESKENSGKQGVLHAADARGLTGEVAAGQRGRRHVDDRTDGEDPRRPPDADRDQGFRCPCRCRAGICTSTAAACSVVTPARLAMILSMRRWGRERRILIDWVFTRPICQPPSDTGSPTHARDAHTLFTAPTESGDRVDCHAGRRPARAGARRTRGRRTCSGTRRRQ